MAKKVLTIIKLQIPGGQANPAPPVGPALGQHGVNIMEFCKAYNAQTAHENGRIIPVEITVFEDRSFTFITKTPPAAVLIKEALGLESGSGEPNRHKVGRLTQAQLRSIAETKMPDLNARDVDEAMKVIAGTARSMGVETDMTRARQALSRRARAIDREQAYTPLAALRLLKETPAAKFDETVEVHFRLGLNVRHADEQLRGTIMLPHGIGKDVRVAVFAEGEKAREAEEAGADVVGSGGPRDEDRGRLPRLRRRDRDARPDERRRQARSRARPARAHAEPEDGHRDDGRRQGRLGREGGQARVPHRPRRQRAPPDREAELRRARAARELRRPRRGDRACEAVGREGSLHQADHAHDDDGARHPRRLDRHAGHRRGAGGSYSPGVGNPATTRRRPSAARGPAELAGGGPTEAGSVSAFRVRPSPPCAGFVVQEEMTC